MSTLQPAYREVVKMRDIDECSYEEISTALDIPVGTVKSRLSRARLELCGKLKGV
ncbi:MAG: sigma factor-like helix-turn-helix DNA-binding protein [Pyrinomonadaceae bacterium]